MTNAETYLDELEALQREAAELRSERQQTDPTAAPAEGQGSACPAPRKTDTAPRPTEDSRMIASATPLETCKQDNPQLCYTCIAPPENTRC